MRCKETHHILAVAEKKIAHEHPVRLTLLQHDAKLLARGLATVADGIRSGTLLCRLWVPVKLVGS